MDFKTVLKCYKEALKDIKKRFDKEAKNPRTCSMMMENLHDMMSVHRIGARDLAERLRQSVETDVSERLAFSQALDKIEKQIFK